MRRFVLAIVLTLMTASYAAAQPASALVREFAEYEKADFLTMDTKLFNLARPFMRLDRKTKKMFNALHIRNVDVLNMSGCDDADKITAFRQLSALSDSTYLRGSVLHPEQAVDGSDFLMRSSDGKVSEFLIYSTTKEGEFVIMRIDCEAELKELQEALSL